MQGMDVSAPGSSGAPAAGGAPVLYRSQSKKGLEEIRYAGGNFLDGRLMEVMANDMESVFEQIHNMGVESRQMHQRVTANLEANDQQFKTAVAKNDTELKSQMQENDRQLKEAILKNNEAILKNDLELKRAMRGSITKSRQCS